MAVRSILRFPDPRLREKSLDIGEIGDDVRQLVADMIGRPCAAHHLAWLLFLSTLSALTVAAPASAWARKMTLPQLLEMARGNPGLQASAAATSASEAQVTEAKLNWLPQGDLLSILSPSPNVHCINPFYNMGGTNPAGTTAADPCLETSSPEARLQDVSWNRVFTRTEVKLIQPVFDFGKISAGIRAAEAGVGVSRQKEAGALADTVDYSRVADVIVGVGTGEPHHLLESLARRMVDGIRERFPRVRRVQIELRKLNPPTCPGHPAYAAVRIARVIEDA